MTDKIEALADHLRGTCKSLDEGCQDLFGHDSTELTQGECEELDDRVFCCNGCSWWYEISDASQTEIDQCNDCEPEEDEE